MDTENIEQIKRKMIGYRDFFGGTLINVDDIIKSTSMEELSEIIEAHHTFIEGMCIDAQSS